MLIARVPVHSYTASHHSEIFLAIHNLQCKKAHEEYLYYVFSLALLKRGNYSVTYIREIIA